MKKFCLLLVILIGAGSVATAQFSFGVSPGLGLNEAYFGYRMDNFVPFIGIQYLSGSVTLEEKGMEYDYETDKYIPYTDKMEGNAAVLMPFVGAKYFFGDSKEIKPYIIASIYKPLVFGSSEYNGESEEEFEEALENINIWSFQAGYGVEYYFSKSFSVGGEFGLRMFLSSDSEKSTRSYYDPIADEYVDYEYTSDYGLDLNLLYAKFTFNFYFD